MDGGMESYIISGGFMESFNASLEVERTQQCEKKLKGPSHEKKKKKKKPKLEAM
ncbi:hypothetical protein HanIR_Chr02g0067331 [Helianthus annuus]|nr:hypothetical protein HanIR_Chr02g0067331 [Helianthus annuus]